MGSGGLPSKSSHCLEFGWAEKQKAAAMGGAGDSPDEGAKPRAKRNTFEKKQRKLLLQQFNVLFIVISFYHICSLFVTMEP